MPYAINTWAGLQVHMYKCKLSLVEFILKQVCIFLVLESSQLLYISQIVYSVGGRQIILWNISKNIRLVGFTEVEFCAFDFYTLDMLDNLS
jgi:hypothetical protein